MRRHAQLKSALDYGMRMTNVSVHDTQRLAAIASKQRNFYSNRCSSRRPDGKACGECTFCASEKMTAYLQDGLSDAWPEIIGDTTTHLASVQHALIYDYATSPLLPGTIGAVFKPGISQALIYTPRGVNTMTPRIEIVTLNVVADYPLAASLGTDSFAVYIPLGSGVGPLTPPGTYLAISNVSVANIGSFSTSYPLVTDVPAQRINVLWYVGSTAAANTVTLFGTNMLPFSTNWQIEVGSLVTSTIAPPSSVAPIVAIVPTVLKVAGVLPGGFWELTRTGVVSYQIVKRIYIKGVRGCMPKEEKCQVCQSSRNQRCNGSRCGQRKAVFRVDNGVKYVHENGDDTLFSNQDGEVAMIEHCLRSTKASYSGLTIDKKSGRVICGTTGDNLARVPRRTLLRALETAKDLDSETGTDGMVMEYPYQVFASKSFGQRAMNDDRASRIKMSSTINKHRAIKEKAAELVRAEARQVQADEIAAKNAIRTANVRTEQQAIKNMTRAVKTPISAATVAEDEKEETPKEKSGLSSSKETPKSPRMKRSPSSSGNVASILDGDIFSASAIVASPSATVPVGTPPPSATTATPATTKK